MKKIRVITPKGEFVKIAHSMQFMKIDDLYTIYLSCKNHTRFIKNCKQYYSILQYESMNESDFSYLANQVYDNQHLVGNHENKTTWKVNLDCTHLDADFIDYLHDNKIKFSVTDLDKAPNQHVYANCDFVGSFDSLCKLITEKWEDDDLLRGIKVI